MALTVQHLLGATLAPWSRASVQAALDAGPWCWPDPDSAAGRAAAALTRRPEPQPGHTVLLTTRGPQASAWVWSPSGVERPLNRGEFSATARAALDGARAAVSQAVPLLWREPGQGALEAWRLDTLDGGAERFVAGQSIGLSMLLGFASQTFGLPLPIDLVASAAVDPHGRLQPVDDLPRKLQAVDQLLPQVTRVVVCDQDADQARRHAQACSRPLEIVARATAEQVVELALGSAAIADRLVQEDPDQVREWLQTSVRGGRNQLLNWRPVALAAGRLLDHGPWFAYAHNVACRHAMLTPQAPMPSLDWARAQGRGSARILANLVQQHVDLGDPPAHVVDAIQADLVPQGTRLQLHLQGAWARLLSARGDHRQALDLQLDAARAHLTDESPRDATYGLAEAYRMAGLLPDEPLEPIDRVAGELRHTNAFVALSRGRARIQRDQGGLDDLERVLSGQARPGLPHVLCSALRWKARAPGVDVHATLQALEDRVAGYHDNERDIAQTFLALARLDQGGQDVALLRRHLPAVLDRLMARGGLSAVRREWPY